MKYTAETAIKTYEEKLNKLETQYFQLSWGFILGAIAIVTYQLTISGIHPFSAIISKDVPSELVTALTGIGLVLMVIGIFMLGMALMSRLNLDYLKELQSNVKE
jgi:uncharacterized membrane protein YidH (DUF202 family)